MKNHVEIEGILQEAPELKSGSPDGSVLICTAKLIHRRERTAGEPITYYFNIVSRNEAATRLAGMRAGDGVSVEGKLSVRSWVDKNGWKRSIHEIYAISVEKIVI